MITQVQTHGHRFHVVWLNQVKPVPSLFTHPPSIPPSLTDSLLPSLIHSFPPSLVPSLTCSLPPLCIFHPSFPPSSLFHSVSHSLTDKLPHSPLLTQYFTYSLPHSFIFPPSLPLSHSSIVLSPFHSLSTSLISNSFTPSSLITTHPLIPSLPFSPSHSLIHHLIPAPLWSSSIHPSCMIRLFSSPLQSV